jgi:hypothetical protein
MPVLHGCSQYAPGWLCRHADVLLYLAPVAALALVIRVLARTHPVFFVFTVAGTLCHELAHFVAGLLTGARPTGLTVIPRRSGGHWELGSVTFANLRWYNAAPAALAPLLVIVLPFAAAWWRTRGGWSWRPLDLALAFALAPQLLSFWPSAVDWRLSLRSWPWLLVIGVVAFGTYHWQPALFQFVKS